jgi:glycosyltransferase involved in cell wall biosynthesis
MKVGIYAPYLNVCGGGEKYICKIAEILSKDFDVEFIVVEEPNIAELKRRLNVDLSRVNIKKLHISKLFNIPKVQAFVIKKMISKETKNYDLFINQENHTIIPANSRKSVYICQVPPVISKNYTLRNRFKDVIKNLLFDPHLDTYTMIIVYSYFVKTHVRRSYPQKRVEVLYPPIDVEQFRPASKESIILSVGRFFVGGHCKKQLEMIKAFKELYDENGALKDWEYHLVGGVSTNTADQEYLKKCQEEAKGYPIYFHINASFEVLKTLYGKAKIFWHATGLHEDETRHPDRMEHFGITTGEAMAAGCVPVVINKGGQPEIVRNNVDGFLWNTLEELKKYTLTLINDELLWEKMSRSSIERSKDFSVSRFNERAKQIFTEMLENES